MSNLNSFSLLQMYVYPILFLLQGVWWVSPLAVMTVAGGESGLLTHCWYPMIFARSDNDHLTSMGNFKVELCLK